MLMGAMSGQYSKILGDFLSSHRIWHRFIEFDEPVKTVDQAARKVDINLIAKSIVLVDSDGKPLVAILPAENKISYKKVKTLLSVKDVRLADENEVLAYSGYPVGGVPPFNNIMRTLLDPQTLRNKKVIAGGGDVDKLVELESRDILEFLKPIVADLTK